MKQKSIVFLLFFHFLFSDPIRAYFGPRAADDPLGPYDQVKKFIQGAEKSLALCIHEFEMIEIAELLNEKAEEGVKVDVFLEEKWVSHLENRAAYELLKEGKARLMLDQRSSGLMHNKYIIRDDSDILTGSMNFTMTGFFRNFNDIVIVTSPRLARQFKKNYLKLLTPGLYIKEIYPNRLIKLKSGEKITAYFSREGYNPEEVFVREILKAKKAIDFMIYVFSSYGISKALEEQIRKKKVRLRGIFDDSFESENVLKKWNYVPFQRLWEAGGNVKYDGEKAKLHHKQILFDQRRMITGSYNFSKSASKNNNENFLLIESSNLLKQYQVRFEELWKRFPKRTSFEAFVQAKRKDPEIGNYRDYQYKQGLAAYLDKKKLETRSELTGWVRQVREGDFFIVEVPNEKHRHFIPVKLFGLDAPERGMHEISQEPQASYSRQYLNKWIAQKKIHMKVIEVSEKKVFHAVVSRIDPSNKLSINEMMARDGYGFVDEEYDFDTPFKKKFKLSLEKFVGKAKAEKRYLHRKANKLKETPFEFRKLMETKILDTAENEIRYSLREYQPRCFIGNRKSRKYYRFGSSTYMEYMKDLSNQNLIFFASQKDAERAGYIAGRYP